MPLRLIFSSGFALFAMFFGAGNIIYPLALGVHAGSHYPIVIAAFLLTGIGLPFLGLIATAIHQGNYWSLFSRLGKWPSFILISGLILFIGPLFGAPRSQSVAFHTLQPFLPAPLNINSVFNLLYCFVCFCLTYSHQRIVDVIGFILSPVKIILFGTLLVIGLSGSHSILPVTHNIKASLTAGLYSGYSTMDLLAAFFFCSIISNNIVNKINNDSLANKYSTNHLFLWSCVLGGTLLAMLYVGFMLLALFHADALKQIPATDIITAVSTLVLGQIGGLFIGICVAFACLVTSIALINICSDYFYTKIFVGRLARPLCLLFTIGFIYVRTITDFDNIMSLALPLLKWLYPCLIGYCLVSIMINMCQNYRVHQ